MLTRYCLAPGPLRGCRLVVSQEYILKCHGNMPSELQQHIITPDQLSPSLGQSLDGQMKVSIVRLKSQCALPSAVSLCASRAVCAIQSTTCSPTYIQ